MIFETSKSVEQVSMELEKQVPLHGFTLQHIHNIGETLRKKGQDFQEQCKVFEMCSPAYAAAVLARDLRLNMALPCRISVYTDGDKTLIGMISPAQILMGLSEDSQLKDIALEVEDRLTSVMKASI